jgi:hypothetical protein
VKAVDSHGDGVKPFFDVVSLAVVETTAQFSTCEGSQIARSIDEKLCVGDVVFLGEAVQKRRPEKSEASDVRTRASLSSTPQDRPRGG